MHCTVGNTNVNYEIHGEGTPLLMIHGWSPDHRLMKGCMEPLFTGDSRAWQRIYFDLPGMGLTPPDPHRAGADGMLEFVLGVVDQLLPDQKFAVAGESFGGHLARGLVARRPEDLLGVMLLCPSIEQDPGKRELPDRQVLERDDALLASLSEPDRESFSGVGVIQNPRTWELFHRDILPGLLLADHDYLNTYLAPATTFSFELDVEPFTAPTLLLAGRQDHMVGYQELWRLLPHYPRATYAVLDRAGHNLQVEQEDLFAALTREWLTRISGEMHT